MTADGNGELLANGTACEKPEIRKFLRRTMLVREQVMTLARSEVYIRAVMVFPKARVQAPYGSTGKVHCVTDEKLCSYIEDPAFSHNVTPALVDRFVRALQGIGGMEAGSDHGPDGYAAPAAPAGKPLIQEAAVGG